MQRDEIKTRIEENGFAFKPKPQNREMAHLTQDVRFWLQGKDVGLVCGTPEQANKVAETVYGMSFKDLCKTLNGSLPNQKPCVQAEGAKHKQINIRYAHMTEEVLEIILKPHIDRNRN